MGSTDVRCHSAGRGDWFFPAHEDVGCVQGDTYDVWTTRLHEAYHLRGRDLLMSLDVQVAGQVTRGRAPARSVVDALTCGFVGVLSVCRA